MIDFLIINAEKKILFYFSTMGGVSDNNVSFYHLPFLSTWGFFERGLKYDFNSSNIEAFEICFHMSGCRLQ